MAESMIYIVFIDEKPESATSFYKEEDAVKFVEKKWHELMRFHQFSKLNSLTASEDFKKCHHKSYTIRDLDGMVHSAKIVPNIVL